MNVEVRDATRGDTSAIAYHFHDTILDLNVSDDTAAQVIRRGEAAARRGSWPYLPELRHGKGGPLPFPIPLVSEIRKFG